MKITCQRDLENFFRLWICGVPPLADSNGYSATLTCTAVSGSPAINVFEAETNGGIGYLTDTNIAGSLVNEGALGTAAADGRTCVFPYGFFDGSTKHLLFEGAGAGEGQFTLTIYQGTNAICQTSTYIDLHDVKDFYERAVITNNMSGAISNWTSSIETVQNQTTAISDEDSNMIVFVHGFNVDNWHWLDDSDTVFKRLYWVGYHGKFSSVNWPCGKVSLNPYAFNTSEVNAYKAGASLAAYLNQLRTRFPNCRLNIFAHSQGNAVVSEAIKQGAPFDNYILTQGAIPASCFDANAPVDADIVSYDWGENITPESQPLGYRGIYTNLTGRIVNFYNEVDYALATGTAVGNYFPVNWKSNQEMLKPSIYYSYDRTNCWYVSLLDDYQVTDSQECRVNVSRSRTDAVGATAGLGGVIQSSVDLQAQFQFGRALDEHSAQWTRPIQTVLPYYQQVLIQIQPAP